MPIRLACITGGVAEAYYGEVPLELATRVRTLLDARLVAVVDRFRERFGLSQRIDKGESTVQEQSRGS